MRFEIGKGGAFLIFIGLLLLSAAVFAVGLIGGYEMARQNQPDQNQIASMFPVPSPPALEATPTPSPGAAIPAASPAAVAAAPATRAAPSPAMVSAPKPRAMPMPPAAAEEEGGEAVAPRTVAKATASTAATPPHHGRTYNIQIEAVMDKSGADQMVQRLKALGYKCYEAQTLLNGQTWYRVRVGPYDTEEEAKAAQDKLRQQYKAAYTTR
jgi:cell division septation protein DedD